LFRQLSNEWLLTVHFFVNCLKNIKIDPDVIKYAKDIIRDILLPKHLNKAYSTLGITCCVSYVEITGQQHRPKQYGIEKPKIDLILMFEHYIPNGNGEKPFNFISNCTIKISTLIMILLKKVCSLDLIRSMVNRMITYLFISTI
jgi:hypothetical protein